MMWPSTHIPSFLLLQSAALVWHAPAGVLANAHGAFVKEWGYEPSSNVDAAASIDLDLEIIKSDLASDRHHHARHVYNNGPQIAALVLDEGLTKYIPWGANVNGENVNGDHVKGFFAKPASANDTAVYIQYTLVGKKTNHQRRCAPGGNATDGCFGPTGMLHIPKHGLDRNHTYSNYDATGANEDSDGGDNGTSVGSSNVNGNNNNNGIAAYSKHADKHYQTCERGCPLPEFQLYMDYYGRYDYADHFVTSALGGKSTTNSTGDTMIDTMTHGDMTHGDVDFGLVNKSPLKKIVYDVMAYMILPMQTLSFLETSIAACHHQKNTSNPNYHFAATQWDHAIAYYAGSKAENGTLLMGIAEEYCHEFKTCRQNGEGLKGRAHVNLEAVTQFTEGLGHIQTGECYKARVAKDKISAQIMVTLLQGTLLHAHNVQIGTRPKQEAADGTAFMLAILPAVHACSAADAKILHDNLKPKAKGSSNNNNVMHYLKVQKALQRNYECLKVTCDMVGGIWDAENHKYYNNAHPCGEGASVSAPAASATEQLEPQSHNKTKTIVGLAFGGVLLAGFIAFVVHKVVRSRSRKEKIDEVTPEDNTWDLESRSESGYSDSKGPALPAIS